MNDDLIAIVVPLVFWVFVFWRYDMAHTIGRLFGRLRNWRRKRRERRKLRKKLKKSGLDATSESDENAKPLTPEQYKEQGRWITHADSMFWQQFDSPAYQRRADDRDDWNMLFL